jgi:hypothetical protein
MGWSAEFAGGKISKLTKTMDSSLIDQTEFKKRQKEAKKRLLDLDKEIERYYELNKAQESLERRNSRISTAKDSAFGAEKLAYM